MCGIFGAVSWSPEGSRVLSRLLNEVVHSVLSRGNRQWGLIYDWGDVRSVFDSPFPSGLDLERIKSPMIVGHTRLQTDHRTSGVENIQPLRIGGRWSFLHNGIFRDPPNLPSGHDPSLSDSYLFFDSLVRRIDRTGDIVGAIQHLASTVQGVSACCLIDSRERSLYLWRVMAPLYIESSDLGLFFGSKLPSPHSFLLLDQTIVRIRQSPDSRSPIEYLTTFNAETFV